LQCNNEKERKDTEVELELEEATVRLNDPTAQVDEVLAQHTMKNKVQMKEGTRTDEDLDVEDVRI